MPKLPHCPYCCQFDKVCYLYGRYACGRCYKFFIADQQGLQKDCLVCNNKRVLETTIIKVGGQTETVIDDCPFCS